MRQKIQNFFARFILLVPYKLPFEMEQALNEEINARYSDKISRFFVKLACNKMYPVVDDAIKKVVADKQAH